MKRFFAFAAVVVVCSMLFACGGGGNSSGVIVSTGSTGGTSENPGGVTNPGGVVNPPVQAFQLAPIPEQDYVEKINVMVNEEYVTSHSDVEARVIAALNDLSVTFGPKKRYVLNKLITYLNTSEALEAINKSPANFYDNNFAGNPNVGGTTVVFWLQDEISIAKPTPKFFLDRVGYATGFATGATVNGKNYSLIYLAEVSTETLLLGRDKLASYVNGLSSYDVRLSVLAHELRHTYGAGIPEWYSLNSKDNSGTLPDLSYDFKALYPNDPMTTADVLGYNIQKYDFSPLNKWLIEHNANYQISGGNVAFATKVLKVAVKVVDATGNPVVGAAVYVRGGVEVAGLTGTDRNMIPVLETLTTDQNGKVQITNDFHTKWYVKGIKAYSGALKGGKVLTLVDLQEAYWMNEMKDEFVLSIVVQQ